MFLVSNTLCPHPARTPVANFFDSCFALPRVRHHRHLYHGLSHTPSRTCPPPLPPVVSTSTQSLQPLAVVKICLRRLGLAHTGVEGEAEVEVGGSDQLRRLVGQVVGHKRITAVLEELQDR